MDTRPLVQLGSRRERKAKPFLLLVDATNSLNEDYSPLSLPEDRSAAETLQALLPKSTVVKAFNSVFADNMNAERLNRGALRMTTFVCGDDEAANTVVVKLAEQAGFDAVEVRSLKAARYAEAATHLMISIAFAMQRGTECGYYFLRSVRSRNKSARIPPAQGVSLTSALLTFALRR